MNHLQKRHTVMQITKYKEEAEVLDKKAKKNRWFIYGCVGAIIVVSRLNGLENIPIINSIASLIQYCGLALGLDNLQKMIENISKKAGLENMATNLEYQLENDNLEEKEENKKKGRVL